MSSCCGQSKLTVSTRRRAPTVNRAPHDGRLVHLGKSVLHHRRWLRNAESTTVLRWCCSRPRPHAVRRAWRGWLARRGVVDRGRGAAAAASISLAGRGLVGVMAVRRAWRGSSVVPCSSRRRRPARDERTTSLARRSQCAIPSTTTCDATSVKCWAGARSPARRGSSTRCRAATATSLARRGIAEVWSLSTPAPAAASSH